MANKLFTTTKAILDFHGIKSNCRNIERGLPQGSVLGPELFILYINDICEVSENIKCVLFADDTNFICSGDDLERLASNVQEELVQLKLWFDINKLSMNLTKTNYMVFSNRTKPDISLSINNINIEKASEVRFLGVILDDKLKWKSHILHVKNKVSKSLFILSKCKYFLPCNTLRMLYCSIILPYFNYCAEIWGNAYKTTLMPLILLQKRVIRIINKAGYRDHTNPLFIRSRLLKLKDIIDLQTLLIMLKARHKILPQDLQDLFVFTCPLENDYHRRRYNFKQPNAPTKLKRMC